MPYIPLLLTSFLFAIRTAAERESCRSSTFSAVSLFGGSILNVNAHQNDGFMAHVMAEQGHAGKHVEGLSFCEVTVSYTHPGYNDKINTVVWLPEPEKWSGRLYGAGGGGFIAGVESNATLAWAVSEGFAAVTTDGGHAAEDAMNLDKWVFHSPGNIGWTELQTWASTALDDAATLGKVVARAYYGELPSYSYFSGCSTGGRQAYQLAQRYPSQYDGIIAGAPAIFWNEFIMQMYWPQAVMNELGKFPSRCEFEGIEMATLEACDELDGIKDGVVTLPSDCNFDASTLVGQRYQCMTTNTSVIISEAAVTVAQQAWRGPYNTRGDFLWHGLYRGASFAVAANTTCKGNGTCSGAPFIFPELWLKYFLAMDPDFDITTVKTTNFEKYHNQAVDRYDSIIGSSNTNLDEFRDAGGKLLAWHGLADTCITPNATADYTRRLHERDPKAADYYRYFEAPGIDHCSGGSGWFPVGAMGSLMAWVENGTAPEFVRAETQEPMGGMSMDGMPPPTDFVEREAQLCLWPKRLVYVSGDPNTADSFACR